MELALTIVLFLIGIVLIVKGGDLFVDAAAWIAEASGIPKLIIGATVVSLATTLPELIVSVMAAGQGKVDMAVGNAVGSVTANIGLIMAVALIFMPGVIRRKDYMPKALLMLAGAGLVAAVGLQGSVTAIFSVCLLAVFVLFLIENVTSAQKAMLEDQAQRKNRQKPAGKEIAVNLIKFAAGTAGIVLGADLLVDNGSELARLAGVSERIIGVTVIAVGTSLPELVTTVSAIIKKQSALSVGNILGANIIDLTLIMPLCSIISGKALPISATSGKLDLPIALLVGLIALVPALISSRFRRWQGFLLLAVYAAYLGATCTLIL